MKKQTFIKVGDVFNRLTAIEYCYTGKHYRRYFKFKCTCGNYTTVTAEAVISGNTKSCGCLSVEVKKSKRLSKHHSEITAIILGYKRHALNRGFKWLLTRSQVEIIINQNCFYCDSPPANIKKTKNSIDEGLKYSGIDRVCSKKNYTKKNCVPCCRICNYAKSNMSLKEFRKWAIRLGKQAMAEQWG